MADITRDQYDETLLVEKKIFQNDRYAMDDELNVLQDNSRIKLRRHLSELIGGSDCRFDSGFTVQGHASDNTVQVVTGACTVHLEDHKGALLFIDSNQLVAGWTTPSGSDRTDYLYLDVYEDEIDSTEDSNLINPAKGSETCRDLRLVWSFEKSEGSTPGSPPTGHKYISIARIERSNGVAVIQTSDITNLLDNHFVYLRQDGTKALQGNLSVDAGVTIDGTDVSETLLQDGSRNLEGNLSVDAGITVDGTDISETLLQDGSRNLEGNLSVDAGVTIDGIDIGTCWSNYRETVFISGHTRAHDDTTDPPSGSYLMKATTDINFHRLVNREFIKTPNINKIKATARGDLQSNNLEFRLSVSGCTSDTKNTSASNPVDLSVDCSAVSDGTMMNIEIEMHVGSGTFHCTGLHIWGAYS